MKRLLNNFAFSFHNLTMEPEDIADRVNSKETFLELLAALRADLLESQAEEAKHPSSPWGPNARGWENPDLDRFLEAMHAWTKAMGDRLPSEPSWRTLSDMFLAAKVYE